MSESTVDIEGLLTSYVTDALVLRMTMPLPADLGVTDVLAALHELRRRLDRTEELLSRAIRVRASLVRSATIATVAADDAWDQALLAHRNAPVQAGGEYSSAKERYAYANLDILDLRRTARAATALASRGDETVEVVRLCHRGLDGARNDLLATLRALAFESHLDR